MLQDEKCSKCRCKYGLTRLEGKLLCQKHFEVELERRTVEFKKTHKMG